MKVLSLLWKWRERWTVGNLAYIDVANCLHIKGVDDKLPKKIRIEPFCSNIFTSWYSLTGSKWGAPITTSFLILGVSQCIRKWQSSILVHAKSKSQPQVKRTPHSTCLVDGGSLHHFTKQILSQTFLGPLAKPLRLLQLPVLLLHTLHTLNLPGFGAAKWKPWRVPEEQASKWDHGKL